MISDGHFSNPSLLHILVGFLCKEEPPLLIRASHHRRGVACSFFLGGSHYQLFWCSDYCQFGLWKSLHVGSCVHFLRTFWENKMFRFLLCFLLLQPRSQLLLWSCRVHHLGAGCLLLVSIPDSRLQLWSDLRVSLSSSVSVSVCGH